MSAEDQLRGTDSGERCETCGESIWLFRVRAPSDGLRDVLPHCCTCRKYDRPFTVGAAEPTIDDLKRAHKAARERFATHGA